MTARYLGEPRVEFQVEWSYEVDRRPHAAERAIVATCLSKHVHGVLRALGLRRPKVYFVKPGQIDDHLSRYCSGTYGRPHIAIDLAAHERASAAGRGEVADLLESSLLHEYAHAYFDASCGDEDRPEDEEELAEEFAFNVWRTGDYESAIERLRDAIPEVT